MKNISVPPFKDFLLQVFNKTGILVKNMRWKAFFFLNPSEKSNTKETFGFNSTAASPHVKELKEFEDKLGDMINNIKRKDYKNSFQIKLKNDTQKIARENKLIIPADKTHNFYKVDEAKYDELLQKHINKDYKKADDTLADDITKVDKEIASELELDDRIYCTSKKAAFITLKDHKPNFANNPTCRLLNPTKPELGRISKQKLSKMISEVKLKTKFNQWKNSDSVISWFSGLKDKKRLSFIQFDLCDFYASISEDLLINALNFCTQYTKITEEDRKIILQCRKSYLCNKDSIWVKKGNPKFDVTMGSLDSAEICDMVGLFILSQLQNLDLQIGLYRDDGLAAGFQTPRQLENIKKKICKIFKDNQLSITIDANLKVVNFLDVTFDLNTGLYKPFMKTNDSPVYVNRNSNHPPSILKNIPEAVTRRLSRISANEDVFKEAIPPYQNALNMSGYDYVMKYEETHTTHNEKKNRRRRIIWFNPPWSANCSTKIGAKFLNLVDTCFPPDNPLHKIFNRNTLKVSYSCMPNMAQTISKHNSKVIKKNQDRVSYGCNCKRGVASCPLNGACLTKGVVYEATVKNTRDQSIETYTGLTSRRFKDRFYEHTSNSNNPSDKDKTTLSAHIWKLKSQGDPYTTTWKIIDRGKAYNPSKKECQICLKEKYHIMFSSEGASLNSRREIFSTCRHRTKQLLCNS